MVVTYQDKKTNKVNYLELDFLDNKNKEENKNTVGVDGSNRGCDFTCFVFCGFCIGQCNCSVSTGVVSTATEPVGPSSLKTSKYLAQGASSILKFSSATNGTVVIDPAKH